jgi:hypothetical protein
MNLIPAKVGADPKKIAVLAGLVAIAGYFYISNRNSGESPASTPPAVSRAPMVTSPGAAPRLAGRSSYRVPQQAGGTTREFRPSLKVKNIDTVNIDPTLHLDLLAKLKTVGVEAGTRSLFEIGAAPAAEIKVKEPERIVIPHAFVGPIVPAPVAPPPEPKAPPIPLKFYGFVNKSKVGDKRAFFLDGEDIVIASEGDVIKKHYKIVRIGINSAVVEDTEFQTNNQQTLPLEAEMTG